MPGNGGGSVLGSGQSGNPSGLREGYCIPPHLLHFSSDHRDGFSTPPTYNRTHNSFDHPNSSSDQVPFVAPLIRIPPLPILAGFVLASQNISTKTILYNDCRGSGGN